MLEDYAFLDNGVTFFLLFNCIGCVVSAMQIGRLLAFQRFVFLKPSVLVAAYSFLWFQLPLAAYSSYCEATFKEPWGFAILIHSLVLSGLFIGPLIAPKEAFEIWQRITHMRDEVARGSVGVLLSLSLLIVLFLIPYLWFVPLSSSGLYAIFFTPEVATITREESFKVLEGALPRYSYSFLSFALAPLCAVVLSQWFFSGLRRHNAQIIFLSSVGFFILLLISSLTGERGRPVELLLVSLVAYMLRKGVPIKPVTIGVALSLVLAPATILSILREGLELNFDLFMTYFEGIILRAFRAPFEVASWHVQYVEDHGYWGVAGIPKLAALFGERALNVNNIVGIHYLGFELDTVSAGTGYLFTQHACFGFWILPISILQLFFLDFALTILKRLSDYILLPSMSAIVVICLGFLQSNYTTVLLSAGFGVVIVVSALLSFFVCARPVKKGSPYGTPRAVPG